MTPVSPEPLPTCAPVNVVAVIVAAAVVDAMTVAVVAVDVTIVVVAVVADAMIVVAVAAATSVAADADLFFVEIITAKLLILNSLAVFYL